MKIIFSPLQQKHPQYLRIEDYTYELPEDRIAQFPLPERDSSRLLVYDKGHLSEDTYRNIAQHMDASSLVVFNQTKVVQVRLLFRKDTGATIEVFCLEPDARYADMQTAMTQKGEVYWRCLVGGANKWKKDTALSLRSDKLGITVQAYLAERQEGVFIVRLAWDNASVSFAEVLSDLGKVPLPPYMNREMNEADKERYQTIFAQEEGSVAAPTAGLHFTPYILDTFQAKDIRPAYLTLHVGAGTFKQVKSEYLQGHEMHAEWIEVSAALLQQLISHSGRVTAVGTTAMRSLESLYWIGYKLHKGLPVDWAGNAVSQWDPYETEGDTAVQTALKALLQHMQEQQWQKIITRTQIMIAPGYRPRIVQELVTNFHQPHSTLLLLIAALMGDDWRKMYDYALQHGFRFLSYGDGCLIRFR
ncbi:MAG: S-adenosylmethionine:tRNA ribosyltransferase-isomerase [Chitinophagaceae bacterium]|nr:S-adenosylmethionine:tRNA ribosyltransferase-isomerase [Chitinophagaceae bacterium]